MAVVRLIVCCCELVKHETDCECEAVVVKDVLTAVGCCLYVAVFRVGSFAQELNAYRCFVPWRSFNALSIYGIRVMSRMYGTALVLQGVSLHNVRYHTCLTGSVTA